MKETKKKDKTVENGDNPVNLGSLENPHLTCIVLAKISDTFISYMVEILQPAWPYCRPILPG